MFDFVVYLHVLKHRFPPKGSQKVNVVQVFCQPLTEVSCCNFKFIHKFINFVAADSEIDAI